MQYSILICIYKETPNLKIMKTNQLLMAFTLFLLGISFAACDDKDEIKDFKIYEGSYNIPLNASTYIYIKSGNNDYTLRIENPELIEAKVLYDNTLDEGRISIISKQKGETTLYITDNVCKETLEVEIKITDSCICFRMGDNEHPALGTVNPVILRNNNTRNAYFLRWDNTTSENHVIALGTYNFITENNNRYLILNYASNENGEFTDAAIAPTEHKFLLTDRTEQKALQHLDTCLDLGWELGPELRTSYPPNGYFMELTEIETECSISGYVEEVFTIPVGLFDD